MNKTAVKYAKQLVRKNRQLRLVKIGLMRVSSLVQRELKQSRVDYLASMMDIDKIGNPEVSHRDGYYYIMDGQHRVEAVKVWNGPGWEEQHIECWVAEGLTEKDEAEIFLSLNDKLNVDSFQKFKVAIRAGRHPETEIDRIVKEQKLNISKQAVPGGIRAVGTLLRSYRRDGADSLARALHIASNAYGDPGLDALVIDGFGLLCHRYNGVLNEKSTVESLAAVRGGVTGLLGAAEQLRQKTGNSKRHCVAAVAVDIINRNRNGGKKLPGWWKD